MNYSVETIKQLFATIIWRGWGARGLDPQTKCLNGTAENSVCSLNPHTPTTQTDVVSLIVACMCKPMC